MITEDLFINANGRMSLHYNMVGLYPFYGTDRSTTFLCYDIWNFEQNWS